MIKLSEPLPDLSNEILMKFKIGSMELFRYDCALFKQHVPDHNRDCICGLLKISSGAINGWGEFVIPGTKQHFDLVHWASVFWNLKGLSISEGLRYVQGNGEAWGQGRLELAHTTLIDLAYHLQNPSTLQKENTFPLNRSFLFDFSQSYFSF